MPYMRVSISQKLTEDKKKQVLDGLGKALALIPGKSEEMLIANIEESSSIYIGGELQTNTVFIDVRYYSNFEYHIKKAFTEAVFCALETAMGTAKDKMFLTITEYNNWGGFGGFKDEYYDE